MSDGLYGILLGLGMVGFSLFCWWCACDLPETRLWKRLMSGLQEWWMAVQQRGYEWPAQRGLLMMQAHAANAGIYASSDNGVNWSAAGALPVPFDVYSNSDVHFGMASAPDGYTYVPIYVPSIIWIVRKLNSKVLDNSAWTLFGVSNGEWGGQVPNGIAIDGDNRFLLVVGTTLWVGDHQAQNFAQHSPGLPTGRRRIAVDPVTNEWVTTGGGRSQYSTNEGLTWSASRVIPGGDPYDITVDDNQRWIVQDGVNLRVSTDRGVSWSVLRAIPGSWDNGLAVWRV